MTKEEIMETRSWKENVLVNMAYLSKFNGNEKSAVYKRAFNEIETMLKILDDCTYYHWVLLDNCFRIAVIDKDTGNEIFAIKKIFINL